MCNMIMPSSVLVKPGKKPSLWLKDETGKQGCSVDYAESLLVTSPKPGQMTLYETPETIPANAENWGGEELLEWYYNVA